jgi:predicted transcriptional regulator
MSYDIDIVDADNYTTAMEIIDLLLDEPGLSIHAIGKRLGFSDEDTTIAITWLLGAGIVSCHCNDANTPIFFVLPEPV